jgi:hypothetical protein
MATTRTPLQPTETLEAFHNVGCHVYLVRYPKGQEDRARECIARWVRNKDLAFSWADASSMGEQLADTPLQCEPECGCDACSADRHRELIQKLRNRNARLYSHLETAKSLLGFSFVAIALLIWRPWA